jgi:hypothetical protein
MRFSRSDMRGPQRFTQNRPRTFVSAPRGFAAVGTSNNRLLRDFWGCSIFDFFNTIVRITDSGRTLRQVRKVPIPEVTFVFS